VKGTEKMRKAASMLNIILFKQSRRISTHRRSREEAAREEKKIVGAVIKLNELTTEWLSDYKQECSVGRIKKS